MGLDVKQFSGLMNTDDPENVIGKLHHQLARNIRFRGDGANLRIENVPGTALIANPYLPFGDNECIGAFYDTVRQRIFWFNHNSNGYHGIYIYSTQSKTLQPLLVNGSATDGDILGFTIQRQIVSINIIYDSINGDILLYVDSLKRPTGFNITRYLSTPYPITYRSFIDVAKAPPVVPPKCCYENDYSVSVNNLQNALFQFKERFVYDDNQKSVYSTGSEIPLPFNSQYFPTIQETFLNARISIYVQTGDPSVKIIEIWGRQISDITIVANNNTAATPDYFLIAAINKAELGIADNAMYRYVFYNNNINTQGSIEEEVQLFDYVPQQANCQDLLNGNTLIYGGITEGYDNISPNVSVLPMVNPTSIYSKFNGTLFFATCNGVDSGGVGNQITVYLTGLGTNDGSGNPTTFTYACLFTVTVKKPDGTDLSFSHNFVAFDNIANVLSALKTAAIANGFSYVGVGPTVNSITLSYPTPVVLHYAQATLSNLQPAQNIYECYFSFITKCNYDFCIQYYDEKGRTPGAQPLIGNPITIPENIDGTVLPTIKFTIKHRPPSWAKSWQLLRSNNLSYSKRLEWVSNQTFIYVDQNTQQTYAYIGISNMASYDKNLEAATPVVNYGFSQGDRIRFEIQYPAGLPQSVLSTGYDYAILSVDENPTIGGVVHIGNFIKIQYPNGQTASTFGSGNFDFGGDNFQNYKCLIYGVQQDTLSSNTIYHEFGKCYGIGNAGTTNAYHIAPDGSQSADLSTSATLYVSDGDMFFRIRTVPAGITYYANVISTGFGPGNSSFGVTPLIPVTNASYKLQAQNQLGVGSGTINPLLINFLATQIRVRLSGTMNGCTANTNSFANIDLYITNTSSGTPQYLLKSFYLGLGSNSQSYDISFDNYVTIPGTQSLYFLIDLTQGPGFRNGSFSLKLDILNDIPIPIIESSFSDKYNIVANSNSRPSIYDPNAAQNYYPNMIRWGLAYQQGTTLNNTNRFYFTNQDYLDLSRGDIQRMKTRDRIIRFFQNRGCCEKGVYNTFVKDAYNQDILTTTNVIITPNNVKYYEGEFGMGSQFTGLVSGKIQDYFADPVRGYIMRLSTDGLIPISEIYKGQYYIRGLITPYNNLYVRADGGPSSIFGYYDYLEEEAHFVLQGGTSGIVTIPNNHLSFNEKRNAFTSFFDINPEWSVSAEEDVYHFSNGQLYIQNDTINWCNFFGTQYYPSVTVVFNDKGAIKKTYQTIGYQANQFWTSDTIGDITTSQPNQQTGLPQISNLIQNDYQISEGLYYAAFMRDANSGLDQRAALVQGDFLKGNWIKTKMTYRGSAFAFLFAPYIKYIDSPKNF